MKNEFTPEYLKALEDFQSSSLSAYIDPTEAFPSFEISTSSVDDEYNYGHYSSGIFYNFHVSPTSFDLDPYFFFADGERVQNPKFITDFSYVVNNGIDTVDDYNLKKLDQMPISVRPAVFKGPIILSGWGYDTNGLPVPIERGGVDANGNPIDVNTENPDSRNFHYYTPIERRLWKTGPVDLRWDHQRKVWTGGAEFIEGVMYTDLNPGDPFSPTIGSGQIYRGPDWKFENYTLGPNTDAAVKPDPYGIPNEDPEEEKLELVRIYNRNAGMSLVEGDYFAATKINDEWRIIGAGGGGGSCIVGKFKRYNCTATETDKTSIPIPTLSLSDPANATQPWILDFGTIKQNQYIYYYITDSIMPNLLPTESSGGILLPANGKLTIPSIANSISTYYVYLIGFENCKYSSNRVILQIFPDLTYSQLFGFELVVNKLFDCPDSQDCFGFVTDDVTGAEYPAVHPFKYIKHNVRVIACGSNQTIVCNGAEFNAYLITEIDDCGNAGTGESRE